MKNTNRWTLRMVSLLFI